jgi:hypothetical protein
MITNEKDAFYMHLHFALIMTCNKEWICFQTMSRIYILHVLHEFIFFFLFFRKLQVVIK